MPLTNGSHRPATNELTVELPGQQAPQFPNEEPQLKHQEVTSVAYTGVKKKKICAPSLKLPAAAAYPEHSDCLLFLEQMVIFQSKYNV